MDARLQRGRLSRRFCALLLLAGTAGLAVANPAATPACDGSAGQVRLQVRVAGLQTAKGNITITVYPDDASRFLAKGGKLARQRIAAVQAVTSACFVMPAAGVYAIAVYHDANDDHDFNRSFVGMPAEGFGFSRNPKTALGLPRFSEVRFAAQPGDNLLEIQLSY